MIEDDLDVANMLGAILDTDEMAAEIVASGADGLAAAERLPPDVVLLDLELPDVNGLDLVAGLAARAPVIVLTATDAEDVIVTAFENGADDYVTKPFSQRVLVARVRALVRRSRAVGSGTIEHGPLLIDLDRRVASFHGRDLELTRRELDLLNHLAARPGIVVTREELLESVWHSSAEWQTTATITEHVRRVRLKLDDDRWIVNVRGVGYRFDPQTS